LTNALQCFFRAIVNAKPSLNNLPLFRLEFGKRLLYRLARLESDQRINWIAFTKRETPEPSLNRAIERSYWLFSGAEPFLLSLDHSRDKLLSSMHRPANQIAFVHQLPEYVLPHPPARHGRKPIASGGVKSLRRFY
jgi:hypothetical protein